MHEPISCFPTSRPPALLVLILCSAALSLSGCNADTTLARNFSQGGTSADELRVASRPPLSLPPEFTLRPDRPGVIRPVPAPQGAAPTAAAGRNSPGQEALLDAAGPTATPDIRTKVNDDARMEMPDHGFTDQLMVWQRPSDRPPVIQRGSSTAGFLGRLF